MDRKKLTPEEYDRAILNVWGIEAEPKHVDAVLTLPGVPRGSPSGPDQKKVPCMEPEWVGKLLEIAGYAQKETAPAKCQNDDAQSKRKMVRDSRAQQ